LKSHKLSDIPGSEGLWIPVWSPDGKYLLARDISERLLIFDFKTQKWSELVRAKQYLADVHFSHDGRAVYFEDTADSAVHRVSLADRKVETIVNFKDMRRAEILDWPSWMGLAPDDSNLAMRDTGSQEIYALDLEQ